MNAKNWLTDTHLTEQGKKERQRYAALVNYARSLNIQPYQVARMLHLMQNVNFNLIPDGYATPPHTINLCVNNICNLKCVYCDLQHGRKDATLQSTKVNFGVINKVRHELSPESCKKIIDDVAWFRPTIRIPWMEPLLYKHLFEIIAYTKSKSLAFSMLTNGLLLNKFADRLYESGVDALRISLDGPENIHNAMCGVDNAFHTILKGMTRLVERKKMDRAPIELGCYFTLTDKNYKYMVEFMESLEKHGFLGHVSVGFFMFNYVSKTQAAKHNAEHAAISGVTIQETSAQFVNLADIAIDSILAQKEIIQKRYGGKGIKIHFRPDFARDNLKQCLQDDDTSLFDARCDVSNHTLFINPDGFAKSYPQCIFPPVGNIHQNSVLDIWNGEPMRNQRKLLQEHTLFHGCARCSCAYYTLEDSQGTWKEHFDAPATN